MILGEEEADIPTYFNDDEHRTRKKERFFAASDYFAQPKNQGAIAHNFYIERIPAPFVLLMYLLQLLIRFPKTTGTLGIRHNGFIQIPIGKFGEHFIGKIQLRIRRLIQ